MEHVEPALGQVQLGLDPPGEIIAQVAGGLFTADLAQRGRRGLNQHCKVVLVNALTGVAGHQLAQIIASYFFGFHWTMIAFFSKKVNIVFAKLSLPFI
ncbi:hypothetical protein D3C72_1456770 [compost metagenome]